MQRTDRDIWGAAHQKRKFAKPGATCTGRLAGWTVGVYKKFVPGVYKNKTWHKPFVAAAALSALAVVPPR